MPVVETKNVDDSCKAAGKNDTANSYQERWVSPKIYNFIGA
jgi:hypothetical protein